MTASAPPAGPGRPGKKVHPLSSYTCSRCGVEYAPRVVDFTCPVCRVPVGADVAAPHTFDNDYSLRLIIAAGLGNLIIFGLLAWALLR